MRISDICIRGVVCIAPDASILDAARAMREHHVGCLVVAERRDGDARPLGVLTDRDIVLAVVAPDIDVDVLTVGDVMSPQPHTCREDDDLFGALQTMRRHGVRRLPVVDDEGRLAGIVSADDVIAAFGMEVTELARAFKYQQAREAEQRV
ncbi:CBS domain-containing protein [Rehaibacterium terrae]|jgi:CBS domain-containing protein|uniref:CBS domain-containing protein n=1 Tax=Rehaibacterium terrae TaxID=1341696 RepID=A0A7W7Y0R7_9GAMM|nr:CBS domain-containing protein [Rehaibacterium terrae]MBB5016004.1 CBS domain-containing protein [Rehaibacterium terrae]